MNTKPSIKWVNHASFIFQYKNIRLITDPWLFGPAFHNGWSLLSETQFEMGDFADITHIWLSHEHPDHFSPRVLKSIPETYRKSITFLFQQTEDKKVKSFCENLGFEVIELVPDEPYVIDDIELYCSPIMDDSWLLITHENFQILNVNDCVIDNENTARRIQDMYDGSLDLLLTQFSYANWIGNPDQIEERKEIAAAKLKEVANHIDWFEPDYTIPFASFVWFSHEENYYLNETMNTIQDAHDLIAETNSEPVVLYPNEEWTLGEQHDNDQSIAKYNEDLKDIPNRERFSSDNVSMDEINTTVDKVIERVKAENSTVFIKLFYLLRLFKRPLIYLIDKDEVYKFDILSGITRMDGIAQSEADIAMHSESLNYALGFDWGGNTLQINGRFTSPKSPSSYLNFFIVMKILLHNNAGRSFPFGVIKMYLRDGRVFKVLKQLVTRNVN